MGLLRSVSKGIAITGAVVAGGALAVTARSVLATPQPLESALEGESHIFRSREGDIFYTASGGAVDGTQPVLLLHSTHLSASSFEWRRNFAALSQEFRVYAPDLLGFGLSDRPATDYSANTYVTFISDFAREVIGRPALVVARGQSAAFITRAAYLDPHLFSRLVFISPTGIASHADDGQDEQGGSIEALRGVLRRVSKTTVGEVPYAFLTTKTALSLFIARQSYAHSEQITPDLVRHLFATTHQHGARFAPLAFMTGQLDLDVASDFARLQQPALLVWGEKDAINEPLHAEALRRLNPRARLELISSAGNAVQDEQPREINELLRAWFLAPAELVDPSHQQGTPPIPLASQETQPQAGAQANGTSAARPTTPLPATPPSREEAQPTSSAPPGERVEAAAQAAEETEAENANTVAYEEEQSVQAGDLMAALEAQAAAEMPGQLPAGEPDIAPLPEPAAPEVSTTTAAAQPAAPQAAEATSQPARPATRAAPRRTASPKAAASRAPRTSGSQPPAHPEPPQGGGKSPGSRPSGGKKKH